MADFYCAGFLILELWHMGMKIGDAYPECGGFCRRFYAYVCVHSFYRGFELSERRIQSTLLHWSFTLRPSAAVARSGCGVLGLGLDAAVDRPPVTRILVLCEGDAWPASLFRN